MRCKYCNEPLIIRYIGGPKTILKEKEIIFEHKHQNMFAGTSYWECLETKIDPKFPPPRCHICGTATEKHLSVCSAYGKPCYYATLKEKWLL